MKGGTDVKGRRGNIGGKGVAKSEGIIHFTPYTPCIIFSLFPRTSPIMLALCFLLLDTYNYIILEAMLEELACPYLLQETSASVSSYSSLLLPPHNRYIHI